MKCKECKSFVKIQNTDTTGMGLCTLDDSYQPTKQDNECPYTPKKPTCGDCARLGDTGCFTCRPEDAAIINGHLCGGFIDKKEQQIEAILIMWKRQGVDIDTRLKHILERTKEFKVPQKKTE